MKNIIVLMTLLSVNAFAEGSADCTSLISNFRVVSDGIYRGGHPANANAIACLQNLGITTVLDLQGGDYSHWNWVGPKPIWVTYLIPYLEKGETPPEIAAEDQMVTAAGMKFISEPLDSMGVIVSTFDIVGPFGMEKTMDDSVKAIHESVVNHQPIFIHCAHGNDRTGLVVALYRILYENVSPTDAYEEMHNLGHSYVDMITTWPMDLYFFEAVAKKMFAKQPTI